MRNITLQEIGGFITERNVWSLLATLSECGNDAVPHTLKPNDILIEENKFVLGCKGNDACENDMVWNIGSIAFYAIMGVEVFEGKGPERQSADTAIPRISSSHACSELSRLIERCLNHDCSLRPSLHEIHETAVSAMQRRVPRPARLTTNSGKSYTESLVKFWPEEMTFIILMLISFLFPQTAFPQTMSMDVNEELNTIVERCKRLRNGANTKAVTAEFEDDIKWTMLDEIAIDRKGECTINDPVKMLGINNIAARILKYQGGVVNMGGRFRNGQDPRYKYSFIEITVKKGASVSYEITKRKGTQTFAVVPYEDGITYNVELKQNEEKLGTPNTKDGVCYISTSKKMSHADKFTISINNTSDSNRSFVIINYNSHD